MLHIGALITAAVAGLIYTVYRLCLPPHLTVKAAPGKPWRLPPGPKGSLIAGNLIPYFKARRAGKLHDWLRWLPTYGEMTTLHMGNRTWVVLNSDRVAEAIIGKSGKFTGERPHFPVAGDLISEDKRTTIQNTEKWKDARRPMHQITSPVTLAKYGDWYESETVKMLSRYLETPDRWFVHHSQFAASVIFRLLFGVAYEKPEEEIHLAQKVPMEFVHAVNNAIVDFFPWLAKLPKSLQFWAKYWADMGLRHRMFLISCFQPAAAKYDAGTAPPSFVRETLLNPKTQFRGDREKAMYVASSIMGAGTQNTRLALNAFFMAMISHPDALSRMQAEIDTLCTSDGEMRLTEPSDLEKLPYCAATIKELLRWRPNIPIVPQHQLTEPMEFEGYYFPPGTDFLVNNVGLSYEDFKDPENFRPERYISNGDETVPIRNLWAFGGGRRICVGYKVFQLAFFLAITRTVGCFNVTANGEYNTHEMNHPSLRDEPFPVKVTPRSEEHVKLISEYMKNVSDVTGPSPQEV